MATTLFALFAKREAASTAVNALLAAKFTTGDIDAVTEVDSNAQGELPGAIRNGSVLVAVRAFGARVEQARAILEEAGASRVGERPFSWQNQGWEGFEIAPSDVEVRSTARTRDAYREQYGGEDEERELEEVP